MNIINLCKRAKELDSRYLEWDFYTKKWLKTLNKNFLKLAEAARVSYEKIANDKTRWK